MIEKEKQEKASRVIHNSIIHIKMMIVKEKTPREIFDYVNEIEYLPQLLLSKENKFYKIQSSYVPKTFVPNNFANPSIQVKRSLYNLQFKN